MTNSSNRFSKSARGTRRNIDRSAVQRSLDSSARVDAIRALDLRNALEFYGLVFNHQGAALCPFHKEKTASFRVKGTFWHCFGCGETGDLISFVRKMFGLSYPDALKTICEDFRLTPVTPTVHSQERLDRLRLESYNISRRYTELLNYRDLCIDIYLYAWDALEYVKRFKGCGLENESYVSAQYNVLAARKLLEQAEYDCAEYLRSNPSATPRPPQTRPGDVKLPPAPKVLSSAAGGEEN